MRVGSGRAVQMLKKYNKKGFVREIIFQKTLRTIYQSCCKGSFRFTLKLQGALLKKGKSSEKPLLQQAEFKIHTPFFKVLLL